MAEQRLAAAPRGLARLAQALAQLHGWRRLTLATLLGALAALALPPLHLVPLLWPAFIGLLWLLEGTPGAWAAFRLGWAFGLGYFLLGLYWVGIAFLVDAERFAAVMPLAVFALAAGLGLFPALAVMATRMVPFAGIARVLVFAAAWLASEALRGWVLTGFPWNLLGTVWVFSESMLQLAAVTGVWGLSLITLLAAGAAASAATGSGRPWLPGLAGLAVLALIWCGGSLRLAMAPDAGTAVVDDVVLRLVQPNVPQTLKWQEKLRAQHILDQIALTGAAAGSFTHAIWSETAITYDLERDIGLRQDLAAVLPPEGLLLSGTLRSSWDGDRLQVWNSFQALDARAELQGTYDKFHLVPFGEYVPLPGLLPIEKLTAGRLDFTAGPGPRTLDLPGLPPVGPLICYEVIFPGAVTDPARRPAWLLNVTNDGWFGISSGPHQHFAAARLRAVEEGLPLVRVANSGISGVIDAYGRVLAQLDLGEGGALNSPLPRSLAAPPPFARLGNWLLAILIFLAISAAYLIHRRAD